MIFKWKDLIYTNEIGKVAKTVETCMLAGECNDEESLFAAVNAQIRYVSQPAAQGLGTSVVLTSLYEGFNRYESPMPGWGFTVETSSSRSNYCSTFAHYALKRGLGKYAQHPQITCNQRHH
ncbi:hypothetical protein PEC18_30825 [Paucibacter sp. O1-1]|nr:hypothetical protein [Paucibacter sp. O1-1]MDA3830102.1 hypothetical protein [Paucibacter sp. O1-1]